ncbi:hypothetical protein BD410DRAFT_728580 [Rickenella mellea]|uniref:C3H1-type domain-containing protein n=1 Tax=Rickenella mellea TaxID=50990 RepID=A0A4Y7PTE0_9AGAM|nr:hypothetical protein BD410DRAFT_728580 [Rickenella mellea]
MLDAHDATVSISAQRGRQAPRVATTSGRNVEEHEEENEGSAASTGSKRRRDQDSDDESGESSDESVSRIRRKAVSNLDYPWEIEEQVNPSNLSPVLLQTRKLLVIFAADLKQAKASVRNAPKCPDFPSGEWTNVLSGQAIDLNKVLSSLYQLAPDARHTEKVGELEIKFGDPAPTKKVTTQGQWTIAWGKTVRAVLFVFRHREEELERYGEHILQLFGAVDVSQHQRVLSYDQAARNRVAHRRDILLSDFAAFADLQIQYLTAAGSAATASTSSSTSKSVTRNPTDRRLEACRRYNLGKCPKTAATCTYLHVCSVCDDETHVADKCQKKSRN